MMNRVYEVRTLKRWYQRLLASIAAISLKLYCTTLRVSVDDRTSQILKNVKTPTLFLFWHNNLFVAHKLNKLLNSTLPMYGLVSPSRDGAWLAEILHKLGILSVRGSSRRNGLVAISDILDKLSGIGHVALTPDGPRGPMCKFKTGAAMILKNSNANAVLTAIIYQRYFSLSSWDKFKIPFPFSRIHMSMKMIDNQNIINLKTKDLTKLLEDELLEMQSLSFNHS